MVHLYTCFFSTILAVSVNRSSSITQSDEKCKHRDVLYVCADRPYIIPILLLFVCFLHCHPYFTFHFKQLFFIPVILYDDSSYLLRINIAGIFFLLTVP